MFESSVQVTASIYGGLSKAFYNFSSCLPTWRIVRWRYLYDHDANRGLYFAIIYLGRFHLFYLLYNLAENYTYMSSDCVGLPEASGEGDVGAHCSAIVAALLNGSSLSVRLRVKSEWTWWKRCSLIVLPRHLHRFNNQRCPHLTYVDSESNCNLLSDTKSCSGELI